VPTRRNSVRFIDTYAGFEGESDLLFSLYKLGVHLDEHAEGQGERLHPTLPIFANRAARLFVYWDHEPRMPWQTPAYYASQRRTLRPPTYLRLHENRWTTGISTFITPDLWDPCVAASHSPLLADRSKPLRRRRCRAEARHSRRRQCLLGRHEARPGESSHLETDTDGTAEPRRDD
jgi:hypothetical protein